MSEGGHKKSESEDKGQSPLGAVPFSRQSGIPSKAEKSGFRTWIRIVAFIVVAVFLPEQVAQAVEYDWRVIWQNPAVASTFAPTYLKNIHQIDMPEAVKRILTDIAGKPINAIKISPTLTVELDKPLNISKERIEEIYNWLKGKPCGSKALFDFLTYKGLIPRQGTVPETLEQDIAVLALTIDILNDVVKPEGNPEVIKSSLYALSKASEFFGLKLYPVKISNLTPNTYNLTPFIAHLKGDHYILITRLTEDKVYFLDEHKEEFLPKDKFLTEFSGYALISHPNEQTVIVSDHEATQVLGAKHKSGWGQFGQFAASIAFTYMASSAGSNFTSMGQGFLHTFAQPMVSAVTYAGLRSAGFNPTISRIGSAMIGAGFTTKFDKMVQYDKGIMTNGRMGWVAPSLDKIVLKRGTWTQAIGSAFNAGVVAGVGELGRRYGAEKNYLVQAATNIAQVYAGELFNHTYYSLAKQPNPSRMIIERQPINPYTGADARGEIAGINKNIEDLKKAGASKAQIQAEKLKLTQYAWMDVPVYSNRTTFRNIFGPGWLTRQVIIGVTNHLVLGKIPGPHDKKVTVRQIYGMNMGQAFGDLAQRLIDTRISGQRIGRDQLCREIGNGLLAGGIQSVTSAYLQKLNTKLGWNPTAFNGVLMAGMGVTKGLYALLRPDEFSKSRGLKLSYHIAMDTMRFGLNRAIEESLTFGRGWSAAGYGIGKNSLYAAQVADFNYSLGKYGLSNALENLVASKLHYLALDSLAMTANDALRGARYGYGIDTDKLLRTLEKQERGLAGQALRDLGLPAELFSQQGSGGSIDPLAGSLSTVSNILSTFKINIPLLSAIEKSLKNPRIDITTYMPLDMAEIYRGAYKSLGKMSLAGGGKDEGI